MASSRRYICASLASSSSSLNQLSPNAPLSSTTASSLRYLSGGRTHHLQPMSVAPKRNTRSDSLEDQVPSKGHASVFGLVLGHTSALDPGHRSMSHDRRWNLDYDFASVDALDQERFVFSRPSAQCNHKTDFQTSINVVSDGISKEPRMQFFLDCTTIIRMLRRLTRQRWIILIKMTSYFGSLLVGDV